MKPYFSKKTSGNKCKIVLSENNELVTDTNKVSDIFNNYFSHVADEIGKDFDFQPDVHPSILKIKEVYGENQVFDFHNVDFGRSY